MVKIKLLTKSKKQYNATIEALQALGVRMFGLGGYKTTCNTYGIAYWDDNTSTDGTGDFGTMYTKRSEFIAEVKRLQAQGV